VAVFQNRFELLTTCGDLWDIKLLSEMLSPVTVRGGQ
jgi:hypothetical protein